jgi:hypothetical protein
LDAWLRPSRTSQPDTRTMIKYSRRKGMDRDHVPALPRTPTAAQRLCAEFWSGTGMIPVLAAVAPTLHCQALYSGAAPVGTGPTRSRCRFLVRGRVARRWRRRLRRLRWLAGPG